MAVAREILLESPGMFSSYASSAASVPDGTPSQSERSQSLITSREQSSGIRILAISSSIVVGGFSCSDSSGIEDTTFCLEYQGLVTPSQSEETPSQLRTGLGITTSPTTTVCWLLVSCSYRGSSSASLLLPPDSGVGQTTEGINHT